LKNRIVRFRGFLHYQEPNVRTLCFPRRHRQNSKAMYLTVRDRFGCMLLPCCEPQGSDTHFLECENDDPSLSRHSTTIIFSTTPSCFHLPSNFNELSLYIPHCCIVELELCLPKVYLKHNPPPTYAFHADSFFAFHFCIMSNANSFFLSFICASFASAFVSFLNWISCRSRQPCRWNRCGFSSSRKRHFSCIFPVCCIYHCNTHSYAIINH